MIASSIFLLCKVGNGVMGWHRNFSRGAVKEMQGSHTNNSIFRETKQHFRRTFFYIKELPILALRERIYFTHPVCTYGL